MHILSLIYPMAALVFLTFIMVYLLWVLRVKAVRAREISPRYFKLNRGGELPEGVTRVTQNYNNLLELPILFYTVCIIAIVLNYIAPNPSVPNPSIPNQSAEYFIYHAWAFVVLRFLHSYIHTTYNHILHRLYAFSLSSFVLLLMWVKVVLIVSEII